MRFLGRRLLFYLLAFFVAVTLNFALPRLMPGSPLDGLILRYGDAIRSNPQVLEQLKASLGSSDESTLTAYWHYLANTFTGDLGTSTSNQVPVTDVVRNTLPWSIFLVGVAFLISFVVGTFLGMVAAWRRGGFVDRVGTPTLMALLSFPAFFLSLLAVYVLGFRVGWFPTQHAYSTDTVPAWSWSFVGGRLPPCPAAAARDRGADRRRLDARDAERDDHDDPGGLRDDGPGQGVDRSSRDDQLRGAERHPAAADLRSRPCSRARSGG